MPITITFTTTTKKIEVGTKQNLKNKTISNHNDHDDDNNNNNNSSLNSEIIIALS